MLLRKITDYFLGDYKREYDYIIRRRKQRFLKFLEYDTPIEILTKEIDLLRETFPQFVFKRIIRKLKFFLL